MDVIHILYTIIIYPLELLFENIFYFANSIISNPGLAIVILSLSVNFLVLPLYIRADKLQKEERETELKLKSWVDHIKKTFKGDERFMMIQAYYRENKYKPVYVFRSTLPLMLQIPFFIAAIRFLSGLDVLKGFTFGPISDMGAPDAMVTIFGVSINLLPILMTVINMVSSNIYTKGSPIKEKIQSYGIAIVFLLLLYKSPAGLVFYWTLNNLFSLIKNVFYKFRNPKAVLYRLSSYAGVLLLGYTVAKDVYSMRQKIFLTIFCVLFQIPILCQILFKRISHKSIGKTNHIVYFLSVAFVAILTGGLIPSAVIASSTAEFVDIVQLNNPMEYIANSFCIAVGFFVIWMSVFYLLSDNRSKRGFEYAVWSLGVVFIVDYLFFGTGLGNLSSSLKFDTMPSFTVKQYIMNSALICCLLVICFLLLIKLPNIVTTMLISGVIVISFMTFYNLAGIFHDYKETIQTAEFAKDTPVIELSRNNKNVIVIMMDRMIPRFIPFIMEEDTTLYDSFDGFTCYLNALSFGPKTNAGSPGLYGGYEYIPERINERDTELLVDKQNEALKVMPVIFSRSGMNVTVFDPKYAGYQIVPDLSIYDDYPEIKRYITMGNIRNEGFEYEQIRKKLNRDFFFYGVFKCSPLVFQKTVYNGGNYNSTYVAEVTEDGVIEASGQSTIWLSQSHGVDEAFMKSYLVLDSLATMTRLSDDDKGCFLMMSNNTTHEPMLLKEPEYEPAMEVDNREYDRTHMQKYDVYGNMLNLDDKNYEHEVNLNKVKHYHITMCTMKKLGAYFDYLKELGVYDNTKIIIASDHSTNTNIDGNLPVEGVNGDGEVKIYGCEQFNCTLMVKDFGAKGFHISEELMTNADVPTLALENVVEDPINPFTNNRITSTYKYNNRDLNVIFCEHFHINENNGYKFLPEAWFSVRDDVRKKENWDYLGYY